MAEANINRIEPEARARLQNNGYAITEEAGQSAMLHSLAISAKRIADALEARNAQLGLGQPTPMHEVIDAQ